MKITAQELRTKYLMFFESKGHVIIPSASLVPENDPSALFTNSGMFPLVPFLLAGVADAADPLALFQADRIHPNAQAQPRMLDNVWPHLLPLLPGAKKPAPAPARGRAANPAPPPAQ